MWKSCKMDDSFIILFFFLNFLSISMGYYLVLDEVEWRDCKFFEVICIEDLLLDVLSIVND